MPDASTAIEPGKNLILVTGAGRSGTSTVTGALSMLGFHVPLPHLQANESNPRGFFESRWPVKFHNRILKRSNVTLTDARPEAFELVQAKLTDKDQRRLENWFAGFAQHEAVVVKDPRAIWAPQLWKQVGSACGYDIRCLTMLRHPTEVIASRHTHYHDTRPWMSRTNFAIWNLCGWINNNLIVEKETRGDDRAVIEYAQLLSDWRTAIGAAAERLGFSFDPAGVDAAAAAEVDDFITVDLRRHEPDWSGWGLPEELVGIAEAVHSGMRRIAQGHDDDEAHRQLDDVRARYQTLYASSAAIAYDTATAAARRARAQAEAEHDDTESRTPDPPPPPTLRAWATHRMRTARRGGRVSRRRVRGE